MTKGAYVTCPMCGTPVSVSTANDGTSSYEPIQMFCEACGKPWRFDNASARAYTCPCGGTKAVGTVTFRG